MQVSKLVWMLSLALLVMMVGALSPGTAWGEHPWDENQFSGDGIDPNGIPGTNGEGDFGIVEPIDPLKIDSEPGGNGAFDLIGTTYFWVGLLLDSDKTAIFKESETVMYPYTTGIFKDSEKCRSVN